MARGAGAMVALLLGGAHLLGPAPAAAQEGDDEIQVRFESDRKLELSLFYENRDPELGRAVARCRTPCTLHVPPDRYQVHVAETDSTLSGTRTMALEKSQRFEVTPKTSLQRYGGLALAGAGLAAVVTGGVLMLEGLSGRGSAGCSELGCSTDSGLLLGGLALNLTGLAVTPIGIVLFAQSYRPAVERVPPRWGQVPSPTAVGRWGMGFGAAW